MGPMISFALTGSTQNEPDAPAELPLPATVGKAHDLPWFSEAVRHIRMLRIEENNDLGPAVSNT
jgi:hypothetical protein